MERSGNCDSLSVEAEHNEFYRQLIHSQEGFISPELQERIRQAKILIAGAGSIGSPIVEAWVRCGGEDLNIRDPDIVENKNLNRQRFTNRQIGVNKAVATRDNIHNINPYARVTVDTDGITVDNVGAAVEDATIIVDGVDIGAFEIMYLLHVEAARQRKPVVVGYDIAGRAMVKIYRYDKENIEPLNGIVKEQKVNEFILYKEAYKQGHISLEEFMNYIYEFIINIIGPEHIPYEQWLELIQRQEGETRTFQLGTTSTMLSSIATEAMIGILDGKDVQDTIVVDLPSIVREPRTFEEEIFIAGEAYSLVRKRAERVKNKVYASVS